MFGGLRGLAQSFVRGAVAIGRAASATYTALTELGLGYVREQFQIDWDIYDQQKAFVGMARERPLDELISGALHGESQLNLTARFKYDVKALYEDIKGKTLTKHWSVISDVRLSQAEVLAVADIFAEEYAPDKYPFHEAAEIEGIWFRQRARA